MAFTDMKQKTVFKAWDITKERILVPPQTMCDLKGKRFILLANFFAYIEPNMASKRSHLRESQPPKPWVIKLATPSDSLVFYVPYLQMCKILTQRFLEQKVGVPEHFENYKIAIRFDYPMLQVYRATE